MRHDRRPADPGADLARDMGRCLGAADGAAMTQPRIIRVTDPEASAQEARDELRDVHTLMMVRGVVTEAVAEAVKLHMPTSEERAYLGLAVRRAARREALQRAIIEKSLTGLVWAAVVFVGVVFFEYLQAHGWKA